jgi:WD40 repeat protein
LSLSVIVLCFLDQFLWTGSLDHTIRVWDVGSGRCLGVLTSLNGGKGHTAPVSCFAVIHAGPNKELHMASGGFDNEVKVWKMNGEFTHSVSHSAWVTALCPFQDSLGGILALFVIVGIIYTFFPVCVD